MILRQLGILMTVAAILVCSFEGACADHDLAEALEQAQVGVHLSATGSHDDHCDHCPFCTGGVTPMATPAELATLPVSFAELAFLPRSTPSGVQSSAFHPPRA